MLNNFNVIYLLYFNILLQIHNVGKRHENAREISNREVNLKYSTYKES